MLVEGFDDSVLLFVVVLASIFIFIFWHLKQLTNRHAHAQLHPDSLADITVTRELLAQQNEQPTATTRTRTRRFNRTDSAQCPICLGPFDYPTETNCGHAFCANCIVQHWKIRTHNLLHAKVTCPICRQPVNIMLPLFALETQELTPEYRIIIHDINSYNKKFSGAPRPFIEYIYDLPTMLRHAINELFSLNGLNFWYRIRLTVIIVIAICYLLSPFDLIPESVYGIVGIVDDFCILFLLAIYVSIFYRQFVTNRNE